MAPTEVEQEVAKATAASLSRMVRYEHFFCEVHSLSPRGGTRGRAHKGIIGMICLDCFVDFPPKSGFYKKMCFWGFPKLNDRYFFKNIFVFWNVYAGMLNAFKNEKSIMKNSKNETSKTGSTIKKWKMKNGPNPFEDSNPWSWPPLAPPVSSCWNRGARRANWQFPICFI